MSNATLYRDPADPELQPLYLAHGRAFATWGLIEHWLAQWFGTITGLTQPLAEDLFSAPAGFRAKGDLASAALADTALTGWARQFAQEAFEKAGSYSHARNLLAHGRPFIVGGRDRKPMWGPSKALRDASYFSESLSVGQIDRAASSFTILYHALAGAHVQAVTGRAYGTDDHLLSVRGLPNDPFTNEISKRQTGRQRQENVKTASQAKKAQTR
jgi:hypothetical protein